ncbi:MAG: DUF1565 domain-containing protein [bacterium]|jgi:hypothetical protein
MRTAICAAALIAVASILVIAGCGGDDGSSPTPVTGVSISPDAMDIEVSHSRQLTATVSGSNKNLTWYVNGIENGNEIVGEITENSPVTYTAPNWLPDPSTVLIKAVSEEDTTLYDSCTVHITFDKLFVDPVSGNDSNNGCMNFPFATLTHACDEVDSGGTILAQPGVYSEASGEDFPIICHEDAVTMVGMDWEQCIIRGSSTGGYGLIVSIGRTGQALRKFTLEEGPPRDSSDVMILVWGLDVHVDSIKVNERADYAVCRGENAGGTNLLIENCEFVVDDGLTMDRGINLFDDSEGAIVRNCKITGFNVGLRITNNCDALVEYCTIEGNYIGVETGYEDSPNSVNPDFGGGARGSAGQNIIRNNTECGLWLELDHPIYAKYNTWTNDPPVAGDDYCVVGDGGVIFE